LKKNLDRNDKVDMDHIRNKYPHMEVPERARRDFIDRMDNEGRFV
jgi:hypothetical protein